VSSSTAAPSFTAAPAGGTNGCSGSTDAAIYTAGTGWSCHQITPGTGSVTSVATASPITGGPITTTGTIGCSTCAIGPGSSTANHIAEFSGTDGVTLKDGGAASGGTVTSVATGTGLTGGPITTTGTISVANNGIANAQLAVVQTYRTCNIDNDTQSAAPLAAALFSGGCVVPAASTIVEIDVEGGTGTLTGSAAAPTVTGTSSVQIGKYTPSSGSSTTGLLSAALATSSGKACALPTAGTATCGILGIQQAGSSLSISTTALAAGDMIYVSAATADGTQTWYRIQVHYTVN
jgi:trimeric autotransporter adhesin